MAAFACRALKGVHGGGRLFWGEGNALARAAGVGMEERGLVLMLVVAQSRVVVPLLSYTLHSCPLMQTQTPPAGSACVA